MKATAYIIIFVGDDADLDRHNVLWYGVVWHGGENMARACATGENDAALNGGDRRTGSTIGCYNNDAAHSLSATCAFG